MLVGKIESSSFFELAREAKFKRHRFGVSGPMTFSFSLGVVIRNFKLIII